MRVETRSQLLGFSGAIFREVAHGRDVSGEGVRDFQTHFLMKP
jgi:hypothetical protein